MPRQKKLTFEEKLRLQALEEELIKRQNYQEINILNECLPHQLAFIKDTSKRKSICGTRRSSKSFCLALYLISEALITPKGKFIYLALTNESAKRTMWSDIFETIILKYDLKITLLTSKLEIQFPNGAIIYLAGLDATPKQMHKLRGQKYSLAVIDECQDFQQDLQQIINSVLKMALAQTGATLCLAGTPGDSQGTHYWWLVNQPDTKETEWKRFFFDWRNNSSIDPISNQPVNKMIQTEVDADINRNPKIIETPAWQQEIDGKWVIATSARIYKYESINSVSTLPSKEFLSTAIIGLGLDFGFFPDPNGLVIAAYNLRFDNKLYVLKSFMRGEIPTQQLATIIRELDKQYHFSFMVADQGGLGKQIAFDLQDTYGLPIKPAEKQGKLAHQNMINSDFITEQIVIYEPDNKELILQLEKVIWNRKDLRAGKYTEDAGFDNHLTDSLLYLHHFSRHNWYEAPKKENPFPTSDEMYSILTKTLMKKQQTIQQIDWSEPNA